MIIFVKYIFWSSLFLLAYSYMLYPILLMIGNKIWPPKTFLIADHCPAVTIIIAAYNEEKVIRSRIENLLSLDYPKEKLEIIIASDGSDDATVDIITEYLDKGVTLRDNKSRRGKVNVLNETVVLAKHDVIVFSDANTMFSHNAVKLLVRYFVDDKVGCVCGGLHFVNADGSHTGDLEGIYWRYETMIKKMEGRRGSLLGANGAIFALRKELFYYAPGDTIVEDFMVPMKILQQGFLVVYAPEANAVEKAAHKVIHEKQRRIRIGAGDFQALFRLLPMLNPFKGFSALAFLSHKVLRWFGPFFLMGLLLSNTILISENIYFIIFCFQCVFYMSSIIGQVLSHWGLKNKLFSICYYFVSMNLALFLGFIRFASRKQKVTWQRTER